MLRLAIILSVALSGCSYAYHVGARVSRAKNTCPTTSMVLADFFVSSALFGIAGIKQIADKNREAVAYGAGGMTVFALSTVAEIACLP